MENGIKIRPLNENTLLRLSEMQEVVELLIATGNFSDEEVNIALELLQSNDEDYQIMVAEYTSPAKLYEIVGFVIWGSTPGTQSTWDLYWLAVHPKFYGKGVAQELLHHCENKIIENNGSVIVIETSGRDSYARTRKFYEKSGYKQVGLISNYYKIGEDLVIYGKSI